MSNRSKKAQFSRSLSNKKSIHIGGKSEKVTPPPLKKPTSVLDNCTPEEIRDLKERVAQRNELNVLFFHLKQMADFLEADINQFNSDLHLANKKLSISEKIISPQEHFICEQFAHKICSSTSNNDNSEYKNFYKINYIKDYHGIINLAKTNINIFCSTCSDQDNDNNNNNNIYNVMYNNWAASFLSILQTQYFMAIKELKILKQYEPYIISSFFANAESSLPSVFAYRGNVIIDSFSSTCFFATSLQQLFTARQLADNFAKLAQVLESIAVENEINEKPNISRDLNDVHTTLRKQTAVVDSSIALIPSPEVHVSFDDCFDINCSIIDVDKELSQLDLSNDPSLEVSLRNVYCDFNQLLQKQRTAQKQATIIDYPMEDMSHQERHFLISNISMLLADIESLAAANKPIEQLDPDLQPDEDFSQEPDIAYASKVLHNIVDNEIDLPYFLSDKISATLDALKYQHSCIALLVKERSFYANIGAKIIDHINSLQQQPKEEEEEPQVFQHCAKMLFIQDKCAHYTNIKMFTNILDDDSLQDFNVIPDINQAADIANLFKVLTRFLHCFIVDDYEFARYIVDAYNKPALQQSDLDKLFNEAQLSLASQIEQLKGKDQAIATPAENVAAPSDIAQDLTANEP